jgi:hypothetical protein
MAIDPKSLNLYELDATDAVLTACGGGTGTNMESCVAYGNLPGADDAIVLTDTKLGADSPMLRFTGAEMKNFIERYTAENAA